MPQEKKLFSDSPFAVNNFLKRKGKTEYTRNRYGDRTVRTFTDETGLSIKEVIESSYDGGIASRLVVENDGIVVYEETPSEVVKNEPGEWQSHIKELIARSTSEK